MSNSERWNTSVELEDTENNARQELREMEQNFLIILFPGVDPLIIVNVMIKASEEGSDDTLVQAGETVWQILHKEKIQRPRNLDQTVRWICKKGFTPQTSKLALMVADYNREEAIKWLRKNGEIPQISRLIYDETSEWRSKRSLWIKDIGPGISKSDIREKCEVYGPVVRCVLPVDPETGQPKSYAFVEFQKSLAAVRAMKHLHNSMMGGRKVRISFSKKNPRSSRSRQKRVKPPDKPGKITQDGGDFDVEGSTATSAQSNGWANHPRNRKVDQRLANDEETPSEQDLEAIKKYGKWSAACKGRWQVEYEGYIYIFAKDRKTLVTMWPEDADQPDNTSNKEWTLLQSIKKLKKENQMLRDRLKNAKNAVGQQKSYANFMGLKLPCAVPKENAKLRKVIQDLTTLTNKLKLLDTEATTPSWAKSQKPKPVKKLRASQQANIPIDKANWFKLKPPSKKKKEDKQQKQQEGGSSPKTNQVDPQFVLNLEQQMENLRNGIRSAKAAKSSPFDPYIQMSAQAELYAFAMRERSPTPEAPPPLPYMKLPKVEKEPTPPPVAPKEDVKINSPSPDNEPKAEREVTPDVEMFVANPRGRTSSRQKPTSTESNDAPPAPETKPPADISEDKSSEALLTTSSPRAPTSSHKTETSNPVVRTPSPPSHSPPSLAQGVMKNLEDYQDSTHRGKSSHTKTSSPRRSNPRSSPESRPPQNSLFANSSYSLPYALGKTKASKASVEGDSYCSSQSSENRLEKSKQHSKVCESQADGRQQWNEVRSSSNISSKHPLALNGSERASKQTFLNRPGGGLNKNGHDLSKDWTNGSWEFAEPPPPSTTTTPSSMPAHFFSQSRRKPQQVRKPVSAHSGWGTIQASVDTRSQLPPASSQGGEVKRTPPPLPKKEKPKKKTKGLIMGPHDPTESVPNITHDSSFRSGRGKKSRSSFGGPSKRESFGGPSKRGRGGFASRGGKKWGGMNGASRGRGGKRRFS